MNIKLLSLIAIIQTSVCMVHAQPNLSFESYDSTTKLVAWDIISGKGLRTTMRLINNIPFAPTQGVFYLSLQSDTISTPKKPAVLKHRFPLSDTPSTIYFDAFFAPISSSQNGSIEVLFTNQLDTVLWFKKNIEPIADSTNPNLIPLRWNHYGFDLSSFYRNTILPDSATITIMNDTDAPNNNVSPIFFIDNLRFSDFLLSTRDIDEQQTFHVYPNPASNMIQIASNIAVFTYILTDSYGKVINTENINADTPINVSNLTSGVYFLYIQSNTSHQTVHKVLIKNK